MGKLRDFFTRNKDNIIRYTFLLPILLVVLMSISHVISWYDLGNPISWAIYLSIAIEIFALASISAATLKMKKFSIWLLFGIVTFIQIVGNIFFTFQEINIVGEAFLTWVELINPMFYEWDILDHRRLLAIVQGGTLPFMSLIALYFFIKFNDNLEGPETPNKEIWLGQGNNSESNIEEYNYTDEEIEEALNEDLESQMKSEMDEIEFNKEVEFTGAESDEIPEMEIYEDDLKSQMEMDKDIDNSLKDVDDKRREDIKEKIKAKINELADKRVAQKLENPERPINIKIKPNKVHNKELKSKDYGTTKWTPENE